MTDHEPCDPADPCSTAHDLACERNTLDGLLSEIENEAWVEAVALAAINDRRGRHGWPPMNTIPEGFHNADEWRAQARAAIRSLAPLIIERCAEVAAPKYDAPCGCTSCCCGKLDDAENQAAWREATHISARIRALIQKEASDG